jgi:hypothetical protein
VDGRDADKSEVDEGGALHGSRQPRLQILPNLCYFQVSMPRGVDKVDHVVDIFP